MTVVPTSRAARVGLFAVTASGTACLLAAGALGAKPQRSTTYQGTTLVGPWHYSIGGYTRGTKVPGPAISFRVAKDAKHIVQIKTTPQQLGQPGYCGGDDIQRHEPKVAIKANGSFSGKRVQHRANPTLGSTKITTTFSGKFTGQGRGASGKFRILYHFPSSRNKCDERGTFQVSAP